MKITSWEELNDFGSYSNWDIVKFNKLHKADCPELKKMTKKSATEWAYYFNSLDDVRIWLESENKVYSFCKKCLKSH